MMQRANYFVLAANAMKLLMEQEGYLRTQFSHSDTLNLTIWELVKLRVSQINQCAFCIDMHSTEAKAQGESSARMIGLAAWRDMPLYSEVERAALGWAEFVTQGNAVDNQTYSDTVKVLGEQGMVDLTIAVNAINSWNRIAKTFKPEVGSYKPER